MLSTICMVLVFIQSFITATYVMEACARAEGLVEYLFSAAIEGSVQDPTVPDGDNAHTSTETMRSRSGKEVDGVLSSSTFQPILEESDSEKGPNGNDEQQDTKDQSEDAPKDVDENTTTRQETEDVSPLIIKQRKFELPDLARLFLGDKLSLVFTVTTACDLYGITWVLAAVFASSLADFGPIVNSSNTDYSLYIALFGVLAIPFACFPSVVDQLAVQLLFLGLRLTMVAVMFITVFVAEVSNESHFDPPDGLGFGSDFEKHINDPSTNGLFVFRNLYTFLQVAIFSTAFQFAVPCIADTARDKKSVPSIFGRASLFILVSTMVLSLMLGVHFGRERLSEVSSNMLWRNYHGGTGTVVADPTGGVIREGVAAWAKLLSGFVVVYPAIDGIAVFSLCAFSLGEILMGAYFKDDVHEASENWKVRIFFHILGSLPQIVGALFVKDLSAM